MIRYGTDAKVRSAFSVVIPAATASSEYRPLSAISISESDREMCVEDRWTMVTSAPFSQSAPQMSKAELLDPMTTHRWPRYASGLDFETSVGRGKGQLRLVPRHR
jgi:hypothetical protein